MYSLVFVERWYFRPVYKKLSEKIINEEGAR
jgi:hypothetical protein